MRNARFPIWRAGFLTCLVIATLGAAARAEKYDPVAYPESTVVCGHARFTMLTPTLVRLEWSPQKRFEDRASYFAVNRYLPKPDFRSTVGASEVTIHSRNIEIHYTDDAAPFSAGNLRVRLRVRGQWVDWTPAKEAPQNLLGTARTLDSVSGATQLEPGLLTRAGWTFLDDSRSVLFDDSAWPWAASRDVAGNEAISDPSRDREGATPSATSHQSSSAVSAATADWYLFVYGDDYPAALRDLIAVGGRIPLPPRWAFGAWWSRYWEYSEDELRELVGEFKDHGVPLDVLVIDMDWHLDGWTGYTWNPAVFPDPQGFLRWCHEQGLHVPLNLHPHDGVHPHERAFEDVCRELGLNPDNTLFVPFDVTDKEYMCAYFKHLHHPLQREGVDFWWIDWQQWRTTRIPGLDPLPWLNYLHWDDLLRNPMLVTRTTSGSAGILPARKKTEDDAQNSDSAGTRSGAPAENHFAVWPYSLSDIRRPLLFSRWGGLGNHRYQIGFSGDTFCDWESLAFQPYFTATAGNVGYAYWSHDIGGHQPGPVDPELYTRWIQWGAFSPILRTHTTKNPLAERRIWEFPPPYYEAMKKAWLLRYELIPYIYTMARKCYDTGLPLCRPLYYEWPTHEEAYTYRNVYMFGDDLLVAPITSPAAPETGLATAKVWLPPGEWVHWFTGQRWKGPRELRLPTPLDEIPLFVRAGAVIPTALVNTGESKPQRARQVIDSDAAPLTRLHVFPGSNSETHLYEDDGQSRGYELAGGAKTRIEQRGMGGISLSISPRQGRFSQAAARRQFEVIAYTASSASNVKLGDSLLLESDTSVPGWRYDADRMAIIVQTGPQPADRPLSIQINTGPSQGTEPALAARTVLSEWRAALGDAAPEALVELLAEWESTARSKPAAGSVREARQGLVLAVFECARADADKARRRHFVARLLGISAEFEFSDGAPSNLQLVTAIQPLIGNYLPIEGTVEMSADGKPLGQTRMWAGNVTRVAVPQQAVDIKPDDVPQSRTLEAELRIYSRPDLPVSIGTTQELLPSINAWWLAGPFEQSAANELDAKFSALNEIDFAATWPGKSGDVAKWHRAVRKVTPDSDLRREFFVAFRDYFGHRPTDACAYAVAFIDSEVAQPARLAIGSDDGNTTWLNGEQVFSIRAGRAYQPRQQTVDVALRAGRNVLVLRVDQQGGDWGFSVFLENREGRPLNNVTIVCPAADGG